MTHKPKIRPRRFNFMKHLTLLLSALLAVSCGRSDSAETASADTETPPVLSLELPHIPETISTMEGQAGYLAVHFWDGLNFADTTRSLNVDFMEQNFVDFLSVLPAVMTSDRVPAFDALLRNASAHHGAYGLILELGDKYLSDPNSPMRNEDYYIDFLTEVLSDSVISPSERTEYGYYLDEARKTRPGTVAPDFTFVTRSGKTTTLHKAVDRPTVLIFTDMASENCASIHDYLGHHPAISEPVASGDIQVLAVSHDGDSRQARSLPAGWIEGHPVTSNLDSLYPMPAIPVIYFLNSGSVVILKDTTPEELISHL